MTKQEELKLLKKCLFYYTLPKLFIPFVELKIVYINKGFCYYFLNFHNITALPKHLKLAYIGSKYYENWRFEGYSAWWIENTLPKHIKLKIRIELLKSAINNLKQQIKKEKL